ncbi:MAG: SIMPL domain-containing protein [Defluviitaleaceae bacterium]|nr:SIMPL domain-containing protein [Defluviitaleaceae bacterium]
MEKTNIEVKNNLSLAKPIVLGLCIIITAAALCIGTVISVKIITAGIINAVEAATDGLVRFKQTGEGGITATGSASVDFKSDQASWGGSFSAHGSTAQDAFVKIRNDSEIIMNYLLDNGFNEREIAFLAVDIRQQFRSLYSFEGNYMGEEPAGYRLTQRIFVSSNDVDKVAEVSRDITRLIEHGVEFSSDAPEYTYSRLDELRLALIEEATKNAQQRVDIIADNANSKVGRLINANLGVFQITAWNSASEGFSSSGTFNTYSIWKTASVTVRLHYEVE